MDIKFPASSLEDLAVALAEGEHGLGDEFTAAGAAVIGWTGNDCPWFVPGPAAAGIEIAPFVGFDVEGF